MKKQILVIIVSMLLLSSVTAGIGIGNLNRDLSFSRGDKAILNEKGINTPIKERYNLDDEVKFCLKDVGINDCSKPIKTYYVECKTHGERVIDMDQNTEVICLELEKIYYTEKQIKGFGESWEEERLRDIVQVSKDRAISNAVPDDVGITTIK